MKTVRELSIDKEPKDSNVITSHIIHKVKANDNGSLKMKARIAPFGNEDKDRFELITDSAHCPATRISILASVSTIMKWPIAKIDFMSAFFRQEMRNMISTQSLHVNAFVVQTTGCYLLQRMGLSTPMRNGRNTVIIFSPVSDYFNLDIYHNWVFQKGRILKYWLLRS